VAHPGDVVLGRGFAQQRVRASAIWTFHILELDDRNVGAGRRLQCGRIMHLRSRRWSSKLRASCAGGGRQHGSQRDYGPMAGVMTPINEAERERTWHESWTTPFLLL
jgi:hypothetical protein